MHPPPPTSACPPSADQELKAQVSDVAHRVLDAILHDDDALAVRLFADSVPPTVRASGRGAAREFAKAVVSRCFALSLHASPSPSDSPPGRQLALHAVACRLPRTTATMAASASPGMAWLMLQEALAADWLTGARQIVATGRPALAAGAAGSGFFLALDAAIASPQAIAVLATAPHPPPVDMSYPCFFRSHGEAASKAITVALSPHRAELWDALHEHFPRCLRDLGKVLAPTRTAAERSYVVRALRSPTPAERGEGLTAEALAFLFDHLVMGPRTFVGLAASLANVPAASAHAWMDTLAPLAAHAPRHHHQRPGVDGGEVSVPYHADDLRTYWRAAIARASLHQPPAAPRPRRRG